MGPKSNCRDLLLKCFHKRLSVSIVPIQWKLIYAPKFFPMPKQFFSSAYWSLAAIFLWYSGGKELGTAFGLNFPDKDANPVIGLGLLRLMILYGFTYIIPCLP